MEIGVNEFGALLRQAHGGRRNIDRRKKDDGAPYQMVLGGAATRRQNTMPGMRSPDKSADLKNGGSALLLPCWPNNNNFALDEATIAACRLQIDYVRLPERY